MEERKKAPAELRKRVTEKLAKTGYPLEVEISDILDAKWLVSNWEYYVDSETKKTRTLDISATPKPDRSIGYRNLYDPFDAHIELAAECKKSESHAWVFFPRRHLPEDLISGQWIDFLYADTTARRPSVDRLTGILLPPEESKNHLHYFDFGRAAASFAQINTTKEKPESRDELFEATQQVCKYVDYRLWERAQRLTVSKWTFALMFPLIVFDGYLFEATARRGKTSLAETKHTLLVTRSQPRYLDHPVRIAIDVVRKDYFRELITLIEADIKSIQEHIMKNRSRLTQRIRKTIDQSRRT